jgi:ATP-dependent DNA ligase
MAFPLEPPIEPMLSERQDDIPEGEGWRYEPKWDGFRVLVFRDGETVYLQSRKNQPLQRYFPELLKPLREALPSRCAMDGEIIIAGQKGLDFDALLQRIHPAASRIAKLAQETPAHVVLFDVLAIQGSDLRPKPFIDRREALLGAVQPSPSVFVTPQTLSTVSARRWFVELEGAGLDGVIAKRAELPYLAGERVMVKVKHERTVDCVAGGYRHHKNGGVGSLLLGLYDGAGILHYVGHTSSFKAGERVELLEKLKPLEGGIGFGQGRTPGGPSRWTQGRDVSWTALAPTLVCEVTFDYLQGDRFRHAARLLRWRPDKPPEQCTFDQLVGVRQFSLADWLRSPEP